MLQVIFTSHQQLSNNSCRKLLQTSLPHTNASVSDLKLSSIPIFEKAFIFRKYGGFEVQSFAAHNVPPLQTISSVN